MNDFIKLSILHTLRKHLRLDVNISLKHSYSKYVIGIKILKYIFLAQLSRSSIWRFPASVRPSSSVVMNIFKGLLLCSREADSSDISHIASIGGGGGGGTYNCIFVPVG